MPAPRKSASAPKSSAPKSSAKSSAKSKASRPDLHPLGEHLAELLNPALVEPKSQGFGESPLPRFETPAPESHPRGLTGAAVTADSLKALLEEGDPNIRNRPPWLPHRPPRPDKSEGGRRVSRRVGIRAEGRPAAGDRGAGQGRALTGARPGAARRHWLGQDLHHGQGDRGDPAPGAGPRAQQDAGRAALWRVQELLSRQCGRVFRLLLRLLPARSLRPAHRHLYREGIRHQRADRPHAPLGDAGAARARRRHHRRLRLLHLRHRLGRDLYRHDLFPKTRRQGRPAPARQGSRRAAVQARAGRRFFPRAVSSSGRHDRSVPGPL